MNNLSSRSTAALDETFEPNEAKRIWDRLEFIYTPKHGSWLNIAEIELNVLTKQCLNKGDENVKTIRTEAKARRGHHNNKDTIIKQHCKERMLLTFILLKIIEIHLFSISNRYSEIIYYIIHYKDLILFF